jgi:hypothetical protein
MVSADNEELLADSGIPGSDSCSRTDTGASIGLIHDSTLWVRVKVLWKECAALA